MYAHGSFHATALLRLSPINLHQRDLVSSLVEFKGFLMDINQGYDAALASLRSCSCKLLNYLACFMSVACSRMCVMLLAIF